MSTLFNSLLATHWVRFFFPSNHSNRLNQLSSKRSIFEWITEMKSNKITKWMNKLQNNSKMHVFFWWIPTDIYYFFWYFKLNMIFWWNLIDNIANNITIQDWIVLKYILLAEWPYTTCCSEYQRFFYRIYFPSWIVRIYSFSIWFSIWLWIVLYCDILWTHHPFPSTLISNKQFRCVFFSSYFCTHS